MLGTFFATVTGKIFAALFFIAVMVASFLYADNLEKDKAILQKELTISDQNTKITTLQGTVTSDANTIKALQQQTVLDASTRKAVADQTREVVTKDQSVGQVAKQKIDKIEQKYSTVPMTQDNITKKDAEISQTRITALTSVFCNSNPGDSACVQAAATQASSAASGNADAASVPTN